MKKLLTIVAAFMLVFGVAGNAMAYFTIGDLQLVAYEGEPDDTSGYEVHFDLGVGTTTDTNFSVDTGITLDDFNTTSWSDVNVGIFGGGYNADFTPVDAIFASDSSTFDMVNYWGFTESVVYNSADDMGVSGSSQTEIFSKAGAAYTTWMNYNGDAYGSYGYLVDVSGSTYRAEAELDDASVITNYDLYTFNYDTWTVTKVGTFTLDTTSGSLVVSYIAGNAVPVPGAFILLASGLLGLIGIRRRN